MRTNVSHARFSPRFYLVIVHTRSLKLFPIRMRKLKGSSASRSSKLTVPASAARSSKCSYRSSSSLWVFLLLHVQNTRIAPNRKEYCRTL